MTQWHQIVLTVCGVITAVAAVLGLGWRLLLPWLREQIVHPIQQTHHQVTVNHHSSDEPTVLDRVDDVQKAVESLTEIVEAMATQMIMQAATQHMQGKDMESLHAKVDGLPQADQP